MKSLRALASSILNGGVGLSEDLAEGSTTAKRKLLEHKHTTPNSLPIRLLNSLPIRLNSEQFNRAGDGAGGVESTATGLGTPKARKNDMRSAREGVFGPGLWAGARNMGFILKASKETWMDYINICSEAAVSNCRPSQVPRASHVHWPDLPQLSHATGAFLGLQITSHISCH